MAYTITCMQQQPDIGFRALSRHTAEGARDLAHGFLADGAVEIEVRDDRGQIVHWRELDNLAASAGMKERDVLRRL